MELLKKGSKNENKYDMWTREQEELLAEWSEKATCYRWLHSRSEKRYRTRNYTFTIPVIILSTLTGTANFAMDSFVPDEYKQLAMACVGGTNIFAGILSTLQNFLRYAELMESHRVCEVQWSKFSRNIAVELALEPKRRKPADDFLKICRADYDRLIEQSPTIDDPIINQFKKAFKNTDIQKPDMCNGLDKCKIYQPSKEEKLENVLTNVSSKLLNNKTVSKKWNDARLVKDEINIVNDIKMYKKTANDELNELKNSGKVSSFKNKISENEISNHKLPIEKIHELVKESSTRATEDMKIMKVVIDNDKIVDENDKPDEKIVDENDDKVNEIVDEIIEEVIKDIENP